MRKLWSRDDHNLCAWNIDSGRALSILLQTVHEFLLPQALFQVFRLFNSLLLRTSSHLPRILAMVNSKFVLLACAGLLSICAGAKLDTSLEEACRVVLYNANDFGDRWSQTWLTGPAIADSTFNGLDAYRFPDKEVNGVRIYSSSGVCCTAYLTIFLFPIKNKMYNPIKNVHRFSEEKNFSTRKKKNFPTTYSGRTLGMEQAPQVTWVIRCHVMEP